MQTKATGCHVEIRADLQELMCCELKCTLNNTEVLAYPISKLRHFSFPAGLALHACGVHIVRGDFTRPSVIIHEQ